MTAQEMNDRIETTTPEEANPTPEANTRLNIDYILDRLEAITRDTAYLSETVEALSAMAPAQGPGDIAGQAKATALADVVRCRETTNQKLIDMYMKMYEDLRPKDEDVRAEQNPKIEAMKLVQNTMEHVCDNDLPEVLDHLKEILLSM